MPATMTTFTSRCGGTVYAAVSKTVARKGLWVRIPPPAPPSVPHVPRWSRAPSSERRGEPRRMTAVASAVPLPSPRVLASAWLACQYW